MSLTNDGMYCLISVLFLLIPVSQCGWEHYSIVLYRLGIFGEEVQSYSFRIKSINVAQHENLT